MVSNETRNTDLWLELLYIRRDQVDWPTCFQIVMCAVTWLLLQHVILWTVKDGIRSSSEKDIQRCFGQPESVGVMLCTDLPKLDHTITVVSAAYGLCNHDDSIWMRAFLRCACIPTSSWVRKHIVLCLQGVLRHAWWRCKSFFLACGLKWGGRWSDREHGIKTMASLICLAPSARREICKVGLEIPLMQSGELNSCVNFKQSLRCSVVLGSEVCPVT